MPEALVTIAVPNLNQGRYLEEALASIEQQGVPTEVFVADAGSTDESVAILERWDDRLTGWRSHTDDGQSAAINECIAKGRAPYVCWLNSDDLLLRDALKVLTHALENSQAPVAYGQAHRDTNGQLSSYNVEPFSQARLARRCIVSQPATLIRREAWDAVGGLDTTLQMAMDYDLWWRLFRAFGDFEYVNEFVAIDRNHADTKTNTNRRTHYREAMAVVRRYHGRLPLRWYWAQPYSVWYRGAIGWLRARAARG